MFLSRNKKNNVYPCKPQFYCIKVGFKGVKLYRYVFVMCHKIERKAMIRNRYNYPTPPIRDIKGKETQTRNNWTLMEISLAESQTDSHFPTKWPNDYPKQKDVSDTHIQRRTITKINHDKRTALERPEKSISLRWGGWLNSILRGHNPRPYFCRGLGT